MPRKLINPNNSTVVTDQEIRDVRITMAQPKAGVRIQWNVTSLNSDGEEVTHERDFTKVEDLPTPIKAHINGLFRHLATHSEGTGKMQPGTDTDDF